jgi:hypothetical protein
MTTTNEVITDALEDLVVQADEAPIEASEAQAAIRFLNDRMTAWDALGITLGYTIVSNLSDEVTVPAGAIMGIKAQLAIDLAEKYNVDVKAGVVRRASEGLAAILNLSDIGSNSMAYPDTLPRGSGNQSDLHTDPFYPDEQSTILAETGGSIALESETEES